MATEYDELIKNLRICSRHDFGQDCNGCTQDRDDRFCYDILLRNAADAIENLENRLNLWRQDKIRRWISVTERLPEKDQTVLAYCAEDNFCYISRMHQSFEDYDVTHWIPLPQMPESEET